MFVVLAAVALHASQERNEIDRLTGKGAQATSESDKPLCHHENSTSVVEIAFCSGEFMLGLLAGGTFVTSSFLSKIVLKILLKNPIGRTPLLQMIGALASPALMMASATAASVLWTDAVKIQPEKENVERSKGILGRALIARASGHWQDFANSPDGAILNSILENMSKIAKSDSKLRNLWLYNTYRFGLLRGETLSALIACVITKASQALVGTALVATGATGGLATPVAAFLIAGAVGVSSMSAMLSGGFPQAVTEQFQNFRGFVDDNYVRADRLKIRRNFLMFTPDRFPLAASEKYTGYYNARLNEDLTSLTHSRNDWMNVMVEKFYEMLNTAQLTKIKIASAELAIKTADLQRNLFVDAGGQVLDFATARARTCLDGRVDCDIPAYQLKALEKLKPKVIQMDNQLADFAQSIVDQYRYDIDLMNQPLTSSNFLLGPLSILIAKFRNDSSLLEKTLRIYFSAMNESVAQRLGIVFDSRIDPVTKESQKSMMEKVAIEALGIFYTQVFDENELLESIKDLGSAT